MYICIYVSITHSVNTHVKRERVSLAENSMQHKGARRDALITI